MTRRQQLISAAVAAFSVSNARQNQQRVAAIMGCSQSFVSLLMAGKRALTDDQAQRLAEGLRDHARRCEMLAELIDTEVCLNPYSDKPCRGFNIPRSEGGKFAPGACADKA